MVEGILHNFNIKPYLACLIITCCNILSWRRILERGFSYLDLVSFTRGRSFEEGSFLALNLIIKLLHEVNHPMPSRGVERVKKMMKKGIFASFDEDFHF